MRKRYRAYLLAASLFLAFSFGIFLGVGLAGYLKKMSMHTFATLVLILLACLLLGDILFFASLVKFTRYQKEEETLEQFFLIPPRKLLSYTRFKTHLKSGERRYLFALSYRLDDSSDQAKKLANTAIASLYETEILYFRPSNLFFFLLEDPSKVNEIQSDVKAALLEAELPLRNLPSSLVNIEDYEEERALFAASLYALLRDSWKKSTPHKTPARKEKQS